jgi:extracellular factor (EF) 3-hydroxypalmitic acid methyl ester biosynthesis protein
MANHATGATATVPVSIVSPQPRVEKKSQKFRGHRVRASELEEGELVALGRHEGIGRFDAPVEDVSPHGAAILLSSARATKGLLLVGDRLPSLRIELSAREVFSGSATVRRIVEVDDGVVLGVEFDGWGANLGVLYESSQRRSFADKFRSLQEQQTVVTPAYKSWVADLAAYLDGIKGFLDQEEAQLSGLDRWSREQARATYTSEVAPFVIERLNRARAELAEFVGELGDDEHGPYRTLYRRHVLPYLLCSPFMKRAFEKPLGYAGDYEMMNMLYRDHAEGESIFGRVLNLYVTQEPAARANINRIELLGTKIRVAIQRRHGQRARIASIGCGPAREISALLEQSPQLGPLLDIALVDQEAKVIEFGERTLAPLAARTGARVVFLGESVRRLLTAKTLSQSLGERDLVYSAGLFDYLNRRSFAALLEALYESVVPGGELAVGNVASHNPTRWWMEYALDWYLLHRSSDELLQMGRMLSPTPVDLEVEAEPLGVNLFLTIRK